MPHYLRAIGFAGLAYIIAAVLIGLVLGVGGKQLTEPEKKHLSKIAVIAAVSVFLISI